MDISRYCEDGIRVTFGSKIDDKTHEQVRRFFLVIKTINHPHITEIIPSFCSCLIRFNILHATYEDIRAFLHETCLNPASVSVPDPAIHEIPVHYGGDDGPDMDFVVSYTGLGEDAVVAIHASTAYRVFSIGFMPGFPYLGTLDRRLVVPRLETPRLKVPRGSVGIAQLQTGIYPFASPGGWQIIGRTETLLFDEGKPPYSLLSIGDMVRFIPV